MTADFKEPLDTVIDILKADFDAVAKTGWNRANTDNIKPIILDIASDGPERGKRLDLQRHDYILCYETALNEEVPDLLYRLRKMENEMRRIIHVNRKGDGANFDRMILKVRTDLSDRTKKLFRHTFQVEVVILAELIP